MIFNERDFVVKEFCILAYHIFDFVGFSGENVYFIEFHKIAGIWAFVEVSTKSRYFNMYIVKFNMYIVK